MSENLPCLLNMRSSQDSTPISRPKLQSGLENFPILDDHRPRELPLKFPESVIADSQGFRQRLDIAASRNALRQVRYLDHQPVVFGLRR